MADEHVLTSYIDALRAARQTVAAGLALPFQDLQLLCAASSENRPTSGGGGGGGGCGGGNGVNINKRPPSPPLLLWRSFGSAPGCGCCGHDFTWESTSSSSAQRLMDMHHCKCCGDVVCDHCSRRKRPVPDLGMPLPERVCDRCFFRAR